MLKCTKILLILILIFILIVAFFRNSLCRFIIYSSVAKATGLKLFIKDLNLDVLNNSLYMQGITLFNPPEFKNKILGRANEISLKYDLLSFLGGRLHLPQVKADIDEVNIIRDAKGNSNVVAFKKGRRPKVKAGPLKGPAPSQRKTESRKKAIRPKFLIDRLEIVLGKVTFIDYRAGIGESAVIVFKVSGPCVFRNVSDLGYVVDSVSAKGGFKSLLNNLLEIIPEEAIKNTTNALKKRIKTLLPKLPKFR